MGRKPIGDRAMTSAERQARHRGKTLTKAQVWRKTLEQITTIRSAAEARAIAAEALAYSSTA